VAAKETLHRTFYRHTLLGGIAIIILLGYGMRFSQGMNAPLLQDIGGSVAYQILLMLVLAFIWPRLSLLKCAVGVFFFSSALEFLQRWQSPFILGIRGTWVGRVILGTTFTWSDFPPYALGCLIGWVMLRYLRRRFTLLG